MDGRGDDGLRRREAGEEPVDTERAAECAARSALRAMNTSTRRGADGAAQKSANVHAVTQRVACLRTLRRLVSARPADMMTDGDEQG